MNRLSEVFGALDNSNTIYYVRCAIGLVWPHAEAAARAFCVTVQRDSPDLPSLGKDGSALASWTDCPAGCRADDHSRGLGLLPSDMAGLADQRSRWRTRLARGLVHHHDGCAGNASATPADRHLSGRESTPAGRSGSLRLRPGSTPTLAMGMGLKRRKGPEIAFWRVA